MNLLTDIVDDLDWNLYEQVKSKRQNQASPDSEQPEHKLRLHKQQHDPSHYSSKVHSHQELGQTSNQRSLVRCALENLDLKDEDQQQLLLGDWLTDKHIRAVNKLLSRQFPTYNGFQDPLLLACPDKPYKSSSDNFIQIINITNIHWVCTSNILSSPGVVEVYDSNPKYSIGSSVLHEQVAKILNTSEKSFSLKHVEVQLQAGANDCALFAIANATTLCFGGDPHIASYNQNNFRAHLANCFELQQMSMFPIADWPRRLARRRAINLPKIINVFCTCRLPWNKNDHKKGALVQCQLCKEWYHEVCMDISKDIVDYPALKYNCKLCLGIN